MLQGNFEIETWIIDESFNRFSQCLGFVEELLGEKSDSMFDGIDQSVAKIQAEYQNEYAQKLVEDAHELGYGFPEMVRQSILVSIWSVFEHNMSTLTTDRILETITDPKDAKKEVRKRKALSEMKKFWEKEKVEFPPGWEDLDQIREVRNLIVHDNARFHTTKFDIEPVELDRHERTKQVVGFIARRENEGKSGLSFNGDELAVTSDFCREVCDLCNKFLHDLIVKLPKMDDLEAMKKLREKLKERSERDAKSDQKPSNDE